MSPCGLRAYAGAVVVITGGASGIGAALARMLAQRGAVLVLADRQLELAQEVADALRRAGASAEAQALDVRDAGQVEKVVADVCARYGRLDYLFNNAGIGIGGEVRDYSLEDWRSVVDVNLLGVIHGVQATYGRMLRQGFGHIVNTASMAGLIPTPFATVYGATKHAVVGLSRALRIEAAVHGVRVSAVCPGVIRTPILDGGRFGGFAGAIPRQAVLAAWERLRPMDVDAFAGAVIRDVARNRSIIIVPRWARALFWLDRLSPQLMEHLTARGYRAQLRTFAAARAAAASVDRRAGSA